VRERDLPRALVERDAAPLDLRAAGLRAVAGLARAIDALARVAVDREAAPLVFARVAVERLAAALRVPVERLAAVLRAAGLRAVLRDDPAELARAGVSSLHLPDITRSAASATASAISWPSLVALDTTLLAACDALSAASRPASRIFLRAAGLAAIAAAAAVSPAASISLLIAALASLSTVDRLDRDDEEPDEDRDDLEDAFLADFAICFLPRLPEKTLECRNGSRMIRDATIM
jgi:hypothetical protein